MPSPGISFYIHRKSASRARGTRRQHVIEGFVIDFYCHELRIALEIDGKIHEKQKKYDELRQKIIEERGINFVHVTNKEINTDIQILLSKIIRS
jgi:very-short-patch-repair endonuclease